jgi:hypothetical protein
MHSWLICFLSPWQLWSALHPCFRYRTSLRVRLSFVLGQFSPGPLLAYKKFWTSIYVSDHQLLWLRIAPQQYIRSKAYIILGISRRSMLGPQPPVFFFSWPQVPVGLRRERWIVTLPLAVAVTFLHNERSQNNFLATHGYLNPCAWIHQVTAVDLCQPSETIEDVRPFFGTVPSNKNDSFFVKRCALLRVLEMKLRILVVTMFRLNETRRSCAPKRRNVALYMRHWFVIESYFAICMADRKLNLKSPHHPSPSHSQKIVSHYATTQHSNLGFREP